MILQWPITIPELSGDYQRTVYLYLPDDYEKSCKKYPVMYMYDGHNVFFDQDATYGKSWGLKEFLDRTNKQMIVVAVACNALGNARLSEYSPFDFLYSDVTVNGRGEVYMNWLVEELKPYIDANYPTLPDPYHTIICGSSMGGLMALFSVCRYHDYFHNAACLSPSLWIRPEAILNIVQKESLDSKTRIYLDYGSEELSNHSESEKALSELKELLYKKGIRLMSRIVPGGTHCEASWEKQIPVFMEFLGF